MVNNISPAVKSWEKPITIARHAYGDVLKNAEMKVDEPGTAFVTFVGESGKIELN